MHQYTEKEIKRLFEARLQRPIDLNKDGEYVDYSLYVLLKNFQDGFNTALEIAHKLGLGYVAVRHSKSYPNIWFIVPNEFYENNSYVDGFNFECKIPGFSQIGHHLFSYLGEGDSEKELIALGFEISSEPNKYRYQF